jgi:hypothetical protein
VAHHAYTVRVEGEEGRDPRGKEYPDQKPVSRLNDALQEFSPRCPRPVARSRPPRRPSQR